MSFPAKFGRYELFRIIIPGFFALTSFIIFIYTFSFTRNFLKDIDLNFLIFSFVFFGIFLGLILYSYDYSKKTQFYKEEIIPRFPSAYLKEMLCDRCHHYCENKISNIGDSVTTYFYVLYNIFDVNSQDVIHYFGSVYRVFTCIRAISGVSIVVLIVISLINLSSSILYKTNNFFQIIQGVILPFIFSLIYAIIYFILNKYNKGNKYMSNIINYQRKYLELKIDKIKEEICIKEDNI